MATNHYCFMYEGRIINLQRVRKPIRKVSIMIGPRQLTLKEMPKSKPTATFIDLTQEDDTSCITDSEQEEETLMEIEGIPFTTREKEILLGPHEWLTDEIINAFCTRVTQQCPSVHCCSTFFYTTISRSIDEDWLRRWKRKYHLPKDYIIIPVNWDNSHWALVVYTLKDNTLRYYDSMMSGSRSRRALGVVREAFEKCSLISSSPSPSPEDSVGVLAFIMSRISLKTPEPMPSFCIETPKGQPQQTDGSSCGVFLCWWVAKLTGFKAVPPPNPVDFRKFILETILKDTQAV